MDDNEDAARGYAAQDGTLAVMYEEDHEAEYEARVPDDASQPILTLEDAERAEKSLRAVRYFREQLAALDAHKEREQDRIDVWYLRESRKLHRRIQWHESALRAYLEATGKKTLALINGTLRRTAGRMRVDVVLPEVFLAWAKKSRHVGMIRVKEEPDKKVIFDFVKATGEEPPGIHVERGEESFSVQV